MSSRVEQYLRAGSGGAWHIDDLVPKDSSSIRLIFMLESPHIEELEGGLPLVGQAGRSALRFLQGEAWNGQSLGRFVADRHAADDARLAVMNVSAVPLQQQPFERNQSRPELTAAEWNWLSVTFRKSTANVGGADQDSMANSVGRLLLDNLQERTERLDLAADCTLVACGGFSQRFVRELRGLPCTRLSVPHPARNQWHTRAGRLASELAQLKELFARHTS